MTITAKMVQELRSKSGAAMMDCKKALEATGGDIEQAFDHLRKAGLKTAEKKAGRSMGEGRVGVRIADDRRTGAMVTLTCETDFVARTDDVAVLLDRLVDQIFESRPGSPEELLEQTWDGKPVGEAVKSLSGKLGENMAVPEVAYFESAGGRIGSYLHHDGKKGVLVSIAGSSDEAATDAFLRDLGMHVAAMKPGFLGRDDVPADQLDREKEIFRSEVEGKPEEIQEKILTGKLASFFKQVVLLDQPWVKDDSKSVSKALSETLGAEARIEAYAHFVVGS